MDVFGGEIRRRDVFPLLVLHLISREPAYGNRLIEEIEAITERRHLGQPEHHLPAAARPGGAGPDRGAVGAPGPPNPPLLLDHRRGPQGVPAAGRRAGALPRLGDRLGDPDQARDLRVSKVSESVVVAASLAEVWDYYFEPRGWPAWVDGFGRVEASDGYPEAGGSLRWRSIPAGRGEVTEHVLEHEPRRLHRVAFRDPESAGELVTRFEIAGEGRGSPRSSTTGCESAARSRGSPTACSSAPRCAARCAAPWRAWRSSWMSSDSEGANASRGRPRRGRSGLGRPAHGRVIAGYR